jgi:hypothetical protein
MRRFLILFTTLLLAACVTPAEPVATIPRPLPEADPAIFLVVVPQSERTRPSMGSAFLVTPTLLVTNRHVVDGVHNNQVLLTNKGRAAPLEGRVVWVSRGSFDTSDLALIELPAPLEGVKPLRFTPPAAASQRLVAAGYPARADFPSWILAMTVERLPIELPPSARRLGTVTDAATGNNGRWFETSSIIVGGISGGPMLDACSRVVGVVTRSRTREGNLVSTLAQNSSLALGEIARVRSDGGLVMDNSLCTGQLPDGTLAEAEGQAVPIAPWPVAGWLPPRYGDWVRAMRGQPTAPGRVSSLAIDSGWQLSFTAALAPDADAADRSVLEYCELFVAGPCRVISRSTGAPEVLPAIAPQPRLSERSASFVAREVPFLTPAEAAWVAERVADRDPSRTAVVVHPSSGSFWHTSDTSADAAANALAKCRRFSSFERDLCLLYWDGSQTPSGAITRAGITERVRTELRAGRPLDPQHSVIEGVSPAVLADYLRREQPKALAGDPASNRTYIIDRRGSLADAERVALEVCEFDTGTPCRLIAQNDVALPLEHRASPRPQGRLAAPSIEALPFVDSENGAIIRAAGERHSAAGRAWAVAIHPSGAYQLSNAPTQDAADAAALASCIRLASPRPAAHCRVVARGDGRLGQPFRAAGVGP